jgi:hypothetical protein
MPVHEPLGLELDLVWRDAPRSRVISTGLGRSSVPPDGELVLQRLKGARHFPIEFEKVWEPAAGEDVDQVLPFGFNCFVQFAGVAATADARSALPGVRSRSPKATTRGADWIPMVEQEDGIPQVAS